MIDDYPTNPHFRMQLAWNLRNQARLSVIQAQGDSSKEDPAKAITFLAEADAKYDKAIETVRQLVTDFPSKQKYRKALVEFLTEHSTHVRQLATGEAAKDRPEETAAQIVKAEKLMAEAESEKRRLAIQEETEAFRRAGEKSKAERQAFVILGGKGVAERKFDTLADAVQGSSDGDTIEIRGNGPFFTKPILLGKQAHTIRAGAGFRPIISLNPEDVLAFSLLRTDGPLVLEGLELQRMERPKYKGHRLCVYAVSALPLCSQLSLAVEGLCSFHQCGSRLRITKL